MAGSFGFPIGVSYTAELRAATPRDYAEPRGDAVASSSAAASASGAAALAPAPAPSLASSSSVDTLMMPLTLLTFGRRAAMNETVAKRLGTAHKMERWNQTEILARRRAKPPPSVALRTAGPVKRIPKHISLSVPLLSAVVDDIRPPDEADILPALRKETQVRSCL